jgi:SUMO ligase MMS21 Smc5/6 complex component
MKHIQEMWHTSRVSSRCPLALSRSVKECLSVNYNMNMDPDVAECRAQHGGPVRDGPDQLED